MEITAGKSILGQLALGRLQFFTPSEPVLEQKSGLGWEGEKARFLQARQEAVLELAEFYDRACGQVGKETASIFSTHAALLEDEDFAQAVLDQLRQEGVTAQYAVRAVGKRLAAAFSAMDSPYMQARAKDIRDISRRVVRRLLGLRPVNPMTRGAAILVADEILPSEIMELDRSRLLGLIARKGSVYSHAAMLLRAYRIPALAEVELGQEWDGHTALLDGFAHRLYLDPDPAMAERLRRRYYGQDSRRMHDRTSERKEPRTV